MDSHLGFCTVECERGRGWGDLDRRRGFPPWPRPLLGKVEEDLRRESSRNCRSSWLVGEHEMRSTTSLWGMWFGLRSFLVSLLIPVGGGGGVGKV